jgi:hypothetical protein
VACLFVLAGDVTVHLISDVTMIPFRAKSCQSQRKPQMTLTRFKISAVRSQDAFAGIQGTLSILLVADLKDDIPGLGVEQLRGYGMRRLPA